MKTMLTTVARSKWFSQTEQQSHYQMKYNKKCLQHEFISERIPQLLPECLFENTCSWRHLQVFIKITPDQRTFKTHTETSALEFPPHMAPFEEKL